PLPWPARAADGAERLRQDDPVEDPVRLAGAHQRPGAGPGREPVGPVRGGPGALSLAAFRLRLPEARPVSGPDRPAATGAAAARGRGGDFARGAGALGSGAGSAAPGDAPLAPAAHAAIGWPAAARGPGPGADQRANPLFRRRADSRPRLGSRPGG